MNDGVVSALVWLVSGVVFVYDIITLPLYSLVQWPWRQASRAKRTRVRTAMQRAGVLDDRDQHLLGMCCTW